jgi:hypothetical protein
MYYFHSTKPKVTHTFLSILFIDQYNHILDACVQIHNIMVPTTFPFEGLGRNRLRLEKFMHIILFMSPFHTFLGTLHKGIF